MLQEFIGKFGEDKLNILGRKFRSSCLNNNNNNNNNNIRNFFLLKVCYNHVCHSAFRHFRKTAKRDY
jgi:hypothetical protein